MRKHIGIAVTITLIAVGFRMFLAPRPASEDDGDAAFYALLARNLLDHHVYSGNEAEPFPPTLVRAPGYPLMLAAIYSLFGRGHNGAVHMVQVVFDTITCWLAALLALAWAPLEWTPDRRRRALLLALSMAAVCPFTAIYVSTVMTEVSAMLFSTASVLAAAWAMKSDRKQARLWAAAGLLGGLAALVRPDCGMFTAAAVGAFLLVSLVRSRAARKEGNNETARGYLKRAIVFAALASFCLAAVLTPWTIRNARVFGVFQPLAPPYANNPDEWVPRGYIEWLRTWVDDEEYVVTLEDGLDAYPMSADQAPDYAFDSSEERDQVAALYERYNDPEPDTESSSDAVRAVDQTSSDDSEAEPDRCKLTPEIDAAFGEIARQRIARRPFRHYVVMPIKRAGSLWFDTHTQYYPFQGNLFPLSDLDFDKKQHYWLPVFLSIVWIYTLLGAAGAWLMLKNAGARKWALMLALLIVPRLAFLAWQEHPEGRYTVEFFPFVAAAAGVALAGAGRPLLKRFSFRSGVAASPSAKQDA